MTHTTHKNNIGAYGIITLLIIGGAMVQPLAAYANSGKDTTEKHSLLDAVSGEVHSITSVHVDGDNDNQDRVHITSTVAATSSSDVKVGDKGLFKWFDAFFKHFDKRIDHNQKPLTITNVHKNVGTTSTVISWTTNESVASEIHYGSTHSVNASSTAVTDATLQTTHSLTLSGLTADTKYYFMIVAHDTAGNTKQTEVMSFHTKANPEVSIHPLKVLFRTVFDVKPVSARLVWVSSAPSDEKVWISTSTPVNTEGTPVQSSTNTTYFHDVLLEGLATSTTYYYSFSTSDAVGHTATSTGSFSTHF